MAESTPRIQKAVCTFKVAPHIGCGGELERIPQASSMLSKQGEVLLEQAAYSQPLSIYSLSNKFPCPKGQLLRG